MAQAICEWARPPGPHSVLAMTFFAADDVGEARNRGGGSFFGPKPSLDDLPLFRNSGIMRKKVLSIAALEGWPTLPAPNAKGGDACYGGRSITPTLPSPSGLQSDERRLLRRPGPLRVSRNQQQSCRWASVGKTAPQATAYHAAATTDAAPRRSWPRASIRNAIRVLGTTNEKFRALKAENLVDDRFVRKLVKERAL